jgi:anti-anti-sigma regulatory factor
MHSPLTRTTKNAPSAGTHAKIEVTPDCLRIAANLQRADINRFQDACSAFCKTPERDVILELTRCTYVSSLVIGILVDTVTQLKTDGKNVTVLVSPEVGKFLHMAHLYHLFSYEIVDAALG